MILLIKDLIVFIWSQFCFYYVFYFKINLEQCPEKRMKKD